MRLRWWSLPDDERRALAQRFNDRLDPLMTGFGIVFLMMVLSERAIPERTVLATLFAVGYWTIWAAFVGEFTVRLSLEPSKRAFLRSNWWQIPILLLPFLRFLRLARVLRLGRAGRVFSSALRASRTAAQTLTNRLVWVGTVHTIVVLATAQILFEPDRFGAFGDALYAAALMATVGQPSGSPDTVVRVVEVALALYSVAFFASLAGSLGAYYLERRTEAAHETAVAEEPA